MCEFCVTIYKSKTAPPLRNSAWNFLPIRHSEVTASTVKSDFYSLPVSVTVQYQINRRATQRIPRYSIATESKSLPVCTVGPNRLPRFDFPYMKIEGPSPPVLSSFGSTENAPRKSVLRCFRVRYYLNPPPPSQPPSLLRNVLYRTSPRRESWTKGHPSLSLPPPVSPTLLRRLVEIRPPSYHSPGLTHSGRLERLLVVPGLTGVEAGLVSESFYDRR